MRSAHLVRAKADTIRLTAAQLLLIDAQRRDWEKRMGQLLSGSGLTASVLLAVTGSNDYIDGGAGPDLISGGMYEGTIQIGDPDNISSVVNGADDRIGAGTDRADAGPGTDACTDVEIVANCEL